jgi:hypothetical protein
VNCTCSQFSSKHGGGMNICQDGISSYQIGPCQVPSCRHYSTDHAFYGKSRDACGTLHCR